MEQAGKPSRWNTLRCLRVLEYMTGMHDAFKEHHASPEMEGELVMTESGFPEEWLSFA
jgi:hypothetical protein